MFLSFSPVYSTPMNFFQWEGPSSPPASWLARSLALVLGFRGFDLSRHTRPRHRTPWCEAPWWRGGTRGCSWPPPSPRSSPAPGPSASSRSTSARCVPRPRPRPRARARAALPRWLSPAREGGGEFRPASGEGGGEARDKPGPRARNTPEAPPPQRIPPPVTPEAGRSRRTPLALLPAWRGSGGGRARPAAGGRAGGMPCSLLPGVPREESWGLIPAPAAPAAPDRPDRPLQWGPSRSRTESDLGRAGEGWARRTRVATPCQPRSPFGSPPAIRHPQTRPRRAIDRPRARRLTPHPSPSPSTRGRRRRRTSRSRST